MKSASGRSVAIPKILRWTGLLVFLGCLVTGCLALNFLKFKAQLRKLDRYVRFEEVDHHLVVEFLEPVMTMDDVLWIMSTKGTTQTIDNQFVRWQYVFTKQYIRGQVESKRVDLTITMLFEHEKLRKIEFCQEFSAVFSRTFISILLSAIGHGDLTSMQQPIKITWKDRKIPLSLTLPAQIDVEQALGQPYSIEQTGAEQKVLYLYTHTVDGAAPIVVQIWLTFQPQNGPLHSLDGWYQNSRMILDFSNTFSGSLKM